MADRESSGDEEIPHRESPMNDRTEGRAALYCAGWLLDHFKIGDRKCTKQDCKFKHSIPPTKNQVLNFSNQLLKMATPLSDPDWDALLIKLGAKPRQAFRKK
jgi:hypothetical protein